MKIAYITKELPFGATEAFILPEIASHDAAGWDVRLIPLSRAEMVHGDHLRTRALDARLVSVPILYAAVTECIGRPLQVFRLLMVMLSAGKPALVLRNLAVFQKALWLARQLRKQRFDHVHIHWIAAPATMGAVAATLARIPYSITAHRYDIAQNNLIAWKAAGAKFVRAIDCPGAEEISAVLPPDQCSPTVIHMGVEVPPVAVPLREGILSPLRIAIAARLVAKKGHIFLLEAMSLASDQGIEILLDVFGDGPLKKELMAKAEALRVDRAVRWRGTTSHDDLLQALMTGEFDASVLPSITADDGDREGIPVFLIESMAIGLPVITTANGGILELAGEGRGLIVPERDAAELCRVLVSFARNSAQRARLGQLGRTHVQRSFAIENCMQELRSLMERKDDKR